MLVTVAANLLYVAVLLVRTKIVYAIVHPSCRIEDCYGIEFLTNRVPNDEIPCNHQHSERTKCCHHRYSALPTVSYIPHLTLQIYYVACIKI